MKLTKKKQDIHPHNNSIDRSVRTNSFRASEKPRRRTRARRGCFRACWEMTFIRNDSTKTLICNLKRERHHVKKCKTFNSEFYHTIKSAHTEKIEIFKIFSSRTFFPVPVYPQCTAPLPFFLVVRWSKNVAIRWSVKCARPEDNWPICSHSKW